ncbi:Enoyl-(Acyl carrier protein) reductase [seawater metagenome]|uniref:Enoyl-(Acyl carrier protein) reductase n=1 Tax=seawater metagenome TaxID=1561972 RepID=A0A5E8CL98_9ZZZZ
MRKILITGASSKIGDMLTKYFLKNNDFVIYHYFKNCKSFTEYENIEMIQCDFTNLNKVNKVFKKVFSEHDIDIVINNANLYTTNNLIQEEILNNINYKTPELINQLYVMEKKEIGCIINITDCRIFLKNIDNNTSFYYNSKKKLSELTKKQTFEFKDKCRINAIALGAVTANKDLDEDQQKLCKESLLGHCVRISDIIRTIEFLHKNSSICGQEIILDCGRNYFLSK